MPETRDVPSSRDVFSQRSAHGDAITPFAELVARCQREGRVLYDLTLSNPTRAGLPYDEAALSNALGAPAAQHYQAYCLGDEAARSAVAAQWATRGVHVDASQIALTASTSEAYSVLFKLFCDPGDAVLVPAPSYPLFAELARYDSVELIPYPLAYDGAWHVDSAAVAAACSSRVRAIISVSPNNPTGSCTTAAEVRQLLSFGVPVISDEVFWAYPFAREEAGCPSALLVAERNEPNTSQALVELPRGSLLVALDGLSKYAALPGLKLAWLTFAGDAERVTEALQRLEFILDAYLSVNAPVQRALPALLEQSAVTRAALRERIAHNLAVLDRQLPGTSVTRLRADAGWCVVLRVPRVLTDFDWVSGLLEHEGVLTQPGLFYDFAVEGTLVVSLLPTPGTFEAGVTRLLDYVARVCR